jgi:hypothetical protein
MSSAAELVALAVCHGDDVAFRQAERLFDGDPSALVEAAAPIFAQRWFHPELMPPGSAIPLAFTTRIRSLANAKPLSGLGGWGDIRSRYAERHSPARSEVQGIPGERSVHF